MESIERNGELEFYRNAVYKYYYGSGWPFGGFDQAIVNACERADGKNMARMMVVFPLAQAIFEYQTGALKKHIEGDSTDDKA